ncbi:glycosyltransferase [Microvirga pudoricolor]|uniref:glycosyltransferase n=1 Tax=Microvirga pudoricolor TaxID=2778729 RepID=UPI001950047F|nr:glycosyltransferase [Microvirga pudoricolor]MBM6596239.1 glycosyltransferase [Microvirga pudoricolor]
MSQDPFRWKQARYSHHPLHQILEATDDNVGEGNIGASGQNLTIATEFETPESLERLVDSLAKHTGNFAGELLLVLDDRHLESKALAESCLAVHPFRWRIVVSQGSSQARLRNAAAEAARSGWLLWLKPTVEVLWNFLPVLQRDLSELGCRFMSVRAHAKQAHFHNAHHLVPSLSEGHLGVGLGSAGTGEPEVGFLATALSGIGYLFDVNSFHDIGGYDETVGPFEDLDLSLRLYRKGYKVGVASITGINVASDLSEGAAPVEGEAEVADRVSAEELARCRFEAKNRIAVLPRTSSSDLVPVAVISPNDHTTRPHIALIVDLEDWAFANIARQVVAALGQEFEFEIIPLAVVEDISRVFMMCENADLMHFFWREVPRLVRSPHHRHHLDQKGLGYDYFAERFLKNKVITAAVYDHLFLTQPEIMDRVDLFNEYVDEYYVCSQRLYDIYAQIEAYKAPAAILPDGVDLARFSPNNLQRLEDISNRPIVLGWVGNSKWAKHLGDPKGLHTILKPAIRELQEEGYEIVEHFADRQVRMISHADMPNYYGQIDVLVCTSEIEGTPNPVLEAMACGVPVITTDVGIVPQAFGELQREFILEARTVAALKDAILRMIREPSLLPRLSAENLTSIAAWDWPVMAARFGPFFHEALKRRARG